MSQQDNKDMNQYFYRASAVDFRKIPGSPLAYWVSEAVTDLFVRELPLGKLLDARPGLQTSDNARFLRFWNEVSIGKVGLGAGSRKESRQSGRKWFPCNKGGQYRKWFGNIEHVVNWENDGEELYSFAASLYGSPTRIIKNASYYFRESVTWSDVTNGRASFRFVPQGCIFDATGHSAFSEQREILFTYLAYLNTDFVNWISKILNPTIHFHVGYFRLLPSISKNTTRHCQIAERAIHLSEIDWDAYERSWNFQSSPLFPTSEGPTSNLESNYTTWIAQSRDSVAEMQRLEEENNRLFIEAHGLQDELTPDVPLEEITLTCNPHYRYGGNRSEDELETLLQCDTLRELVSYAIGCMMGRYSLDKPGLILASQGETLQDYLSQTPAPRFAPDDDAILPLTDQEWFADDATNRFREFVRVVWGDDTLQENLDFVAESLCLHALKPKRGESALDTIRRYLSIQFFKDHLKTYKKRPIYWLFSSGKHKAFECLVYLHRYNDGTLARMRTEYVIPLTAKLNTYANKLEQDIDASTSTAEKKRLEKELATLHNQQAELATFDEKLRHYADQRISLDLDDGVKVNYGKFGDLLADVKTITGDKGE